MLEPSFRHVFCEGRMDRALLSHFIREAGLSASVHRIDDYVDMSELLAVPQESTGVRARLIVLAEEYDRRFAKHDPLRSLTCVIDRDCRVPRPTPALLVTDYSDIEMYTWKPARLTKLLELGYGVDVSDGVVDRLMLFVEPRAVTLCMTRRFVHEKGEGRTPPANVTRYACPRNGNMDLIGFIRAYGGSLTKEADRIASEIHQRVDRASSEDCRMHMNGHDVVLLTAVAVDRMLKVSTGESEMKRAWFAGLDWRDLVESEPMFQALAKRISA
nr:hypothetical protein [Tessaracoccus bendigoensis]